MKPITFIVIILVIGLIGAGIHFGRFGQDHERACKYLEERIAKAERQLQEDVNTNMPLYTAQEVDEILSMFKDITTEKNCHRQYQKFQQHLKQHPIKGESS